MFDIGGSVVPVVNGINWKSDEYTEAKAYVCSVLSHLVYGILTEFERLQVGRTIIVPCSAYKAVVYGSKDLGSDALGEWFTGRNWEISGLTISVSDLAVALVVEMPQVIFVAVRGTSAAYDWQYNLDCRKSRFPAGVKLHKGFVRGIYPLFYDIYENLKENYKPTKPVYFTGHSLGGAMATILNLLLIFPPAFPFAWTELGALYRDWHCYCYTFGAPRFGNDEAVSLVENQYHIYNPADLVPHLPPRCFGYADPIRRKELESLAQKRDRPTDSRSFVRFFGHIVAGCRIPNHSIELYRERLHLKLVM